MTITRVGSNNAYATGWESAFGGKKRKAAPAATAKVASKSTTKGSGKAPATKGKVVAAVAAIGEKSSKSTAKKSAGPKAAGKSQTKNSSQKSVTKKPVAKKAAGKKKA